MAHNDDYDRGSGLNVLSAAILGAIAGGILVFLSDEKNRRRVKRTMEDWREKGTEKLEEAEEKLGEAKTKVTREAKELADQGTEAVSDELERTRARLARNRARRRT
jgi:galactokinase/mevalonate kinase-like predicted kinase